jgi:hypothetical protein
MRVAALASKSWMPIFAAAMLLTTAEAAHAIGDSTGCAVKVASEFGQLAARGTASQVAAYIDQRESRASSWARLWDRVTGGSRVRAQILNERPMCDGQQPIEYAAAAGNLQVVRYLLDSGAKPSPAIFVYCVVLEGRPEFKDMAPPPPSRILQTVELLVKSGVDPNYSNGQGHTALHRCQIPDVLRALLKNGARVDGSVGSGYTPLQFLVSGLKHDKKPCLKSVALIKVLTDHGAKLPHDPYPYSMDESWCWETNGKS